jgi:hypothetical protein
MMRKSSLLFFAGVAGLVAARLWPSSLWIEKEIKTPLLDASSIALTSDGSFVVASKVGDAVKIDNSGRVLWSYTAHTVPPGTVDGIGPEFTSVAAAPDGGVLLCGEVYNRQSSPVDLLGGLLVRLDASGSPIKIVDTFRYLDNLSDQLKGAEIDMCAPFENGFVAIGHNFTQKGIGFLFVRLREDGSIESVTPTSAGGILNTSRPQLMSDGGLVYMADTTLFQLNRGGGFVKSRSFQPGCKLISGTSPNGSVTVACSADGGMQMVSLDSKFETIVQRKYEGPAVWGSGGVSMQTDGTLAILGRSEGGYDAMVAAYDPKGVSRGKRRFWLSGGWFVDGIPTGKPNEWVGVRNADGNGAAIVDFIATRPYNSKT